MTGAAGQSTLQLIPDLEIRIGDLGLHQVTAGVIDLSTMAGQLGHALLLILRPAIVDIDFPHCRIAFSAPANFTAPPDAVRIALGRHGDHRSVPLSAEGRAPVAFDFDLGSNSPVIVYPHTVIARTCWRGGGSPWG